MHNYRSQAKRFPEPDWNAVILSGAPIDLAESADQVFTDAGGILGQYHHNRESGYEYTLRNQNLAHYIGREPDPLLNRIFGFAVSSGQLVLQNGLLCTAGPVRFLELTIASLTQTASEPAAWMNAVKVLLQRHGHETQESWLAHKRIWNDFWNNSFIFASGDPDAEKVTRGYLYQRYFHRAGGLGAWPILFTGSIFTTHEDGAGNFDCRNWGGPYWIQNTRLIYWSILYSGDFALMQPFLKMILAMVPISRERVRTYFRHRGILIPETVTFFGTYSNMCYGFAGADGVHKGGWQRNITARLPGDIPNTYIRWHFNGMLEIACLMLEYVQYAQDREFLNSALAFAEEVLLFFHEHFENHEHYAQDDHKLLLFPVSALETWQICANDAPDIAGLQALTAAVLDR
ncbi:MAG TPA: hypothetical protein DD640_07785, partial [Clostridiales bacterium]|nr:hypothetical protein [Clostridiales bacterium]